MTRFRSLLRATLVALGAAAAAAALILPTASASTTARINACKLLSTKQVAALHIGTSCTQKTAKPNPYYTGVSATWGKLGGHGSVILAVDRVNNPAYIRILESQNSKKGKSAGVGSWSRIACASTHVYCLVEFVVGTYVVELQVAVPTGHKLSSPRPVLTMAKTVAAKLTR